MTKNEMKLAAALLDMAADQFSNHGCNDFDLRQHGLSLPEIRDLVAEYHAWNGDPEEVDRYTDRGLPFALGDFSVMRLMAGKLRGEVK